MSSAIEIDDVLAKLKGLGCESIRSSIDEEHFGNATLTAKFHELRLHLTNDRGNWIVDVGLQVGDGQTAHPTLKESVDGDGWLVFPLEVLAVVIEQSKVRSERAEQDLIEHYRLGADQTMGYANGEFPGPKYGLNEVIRFLEEDRWKDLQKVAEDPEMQKHADEVEERLRKKLQEQLSPSLDVEL